MSAPDKPTFTKRKAIFAAGVAMRMSEAKAMHAPAPAVVPFKEAMTGFGSVRMLRTKLARHAREFQKPLHVALKEWPNDVQHIAARTERASRSRNHNRAHLALVAQSGERVCQFTIDFKRQRVEAFGTIERNGRNAIAHFIKKAFGFQHKFKKCLLKIIDNKLARFKACMFSLPALRRARAGCRSSISLRCLRPPLW